MAAKAEMALILSLVNEVSKTAKKIEKDLQDAGKVAKNSQSTFEQLGKGMAIGVAAAYTAVSAAAVAFGKAAWNAGMLYDDAMDTIAVGSGATGKELEQLYDDFSAVFTRIPTDAATASTVIADLNTKLGISGDELVDLAIPLTEASRLLGTDASASAQLFGQAMNMWQVPAREAPALMDAMFVASQSTGVGLNELLTSLSTFGPTLQTMGFSITESAALFGELEQAGMPATQVMTALQFAAKTFTKEGIPVQEGLYATIEAIQKAASSEEALALGMETFGAKAALPMVEAIRSGRFELDEMTAALEGSEGAIMDTAAATADFPEKLQVLKNVATDALAPIGLDMMDIVTKLVVQLMPAFEELAGWVTEHLVPAMERFGEAIAIALEGDFQGALEHLFGEETAAKIMNVIDKAKEAYAWIEGAIADVKEWVSTATSLMTGWWGDHGEDVTGKVTGMWSSVSGKFAEGLDTVQGIVTENLAKIKGWWSEHGDKIKEIATNFWEGIKGVFELKFGVIEGVFEAFKLAFQGNWYGFGEKLRETGLEAWEKIEQIFADFRDVLVGIWDMIDEDVTAAWNGILDWLKGLPERIIAFFTETDWGQVGQDILQGIVNGLNAGIDWLKDAARNVAQAALNAMKGLLGISSPSRVAELQVGLPLGQGIIEGLRAATPTLLAASRGMLDNAIGAMSGMTGSYALQGVQPQMSAAAFGGRVESYGQEALQQMFEVLARSVTMPLGRVISGHLRGESENEMLGTLRALSMAG